MTHELILQNVAKHITLSQEETNRFTDLLTHNEVPKAWSAIQYPVAHRMLEKCDAVLRLEGASKGADEDVRKVKELGLLVYYRLDDVLDGE